VLLVMPNVTATVSGLELKQGKAADGGIVKNDGTLTLTNDYIHRGAATGTVMDAGRGGGVFSTGALTVAGSALYDNAADAVLVPQPVEGGMGAGIFAMGPLT